MNQGVTQLFPAPARTRELTGLYLAHALNRQKNNGQPFVYSNFITSLDGRISVGEPGRETRMVPGDIANRRDWRLYQELAGQADLLISSGRFFRQSQAGEAQDRLPVGPEPEYDDIRAWRKQQGMKPQPDIAVMSSSLDLPGKALEAYPGRKILVITGDDDNEQKVAELQANGIGVIRAGSGNRVDGARLVAAVADLGYSSVYAIAGPDVFSTLLSAGVIDRLYLTTANRLLGGDDFDTMTRGPRLEPASSMQLKELYHDPHAPAGAGQLFAVYERAGNPVAG